MKQFLTIAFLFCCIAWVAPLSAQPQTVQATVTAVSGHCWTKQNWHLPDTIEIADLHTNPTEALRSTDGWLQPNANTNSTDFTAYPAGLFNATTARFEGLGYQTDWWTATGTMMDETTSSNTGTGTGAAETLRATSLQFNHFCDTPSISPRDPNDAVSVRCVMKNEWPE